MKIVTWMSVLTEHQAHTYGALEALSGERIEYVLGARVIQARRLQGWTEMDLSNLSVHDLPSHGWWKFGKELIAQFPEAVHIFNGMWGDRRFFPLLVYAQRCGVRTCLVTESFADGVVSYFNENISLLDRIRSAVRPWMYKVAAYILARRMSAVFAISPKAAKQFEAAGFRKSIIFDFGYFVPPIGNEAEGLSSKRTVGGLSLVFVGSLIARKGLPTLVKAIELCNADGHRVSLEVYGPGDCGPIQASSKHIRFLGSIPFGKAQATIRQYDVLVVPSLHDGWAVVVNEALLQGVPVICSDAVGASVLVAKSGAGAIFPVSNAEALATVLAGLMVSPSVLADWRIKANQFGGVLNPSTAAKYQMECLQFVLGMSQSQPISPWYP